jgi:flagellar biosynthesis protein FlhG
MDFDFESSLRQIEDIHEVTGKAFVIPFDIGVQTKSEKFSIPPAQCKVIGIASGKGGTGKTTFTINLAITLKRRGIRVLILDADFGLANDHLLLGIQPHGDIEDVLAGRKGIRDVILDGPEGVHLIPGGMGSSHLSNLESYDFQALARDLRTLEPDYDVVLIDLAAGISPQILRLLKPVHEVILVTNPEVTALIDAYGLVKCLAPKESKQRLDIHVVLNRVKDQEEAVTSLKKLRHTVQKHLKNIKLNFLGYIPFDRYLLHSISIQKPAVISHPRSFVTQCLKGIETKLYSRYRQWEKEQEKTTPYQSYFFILEQQSHE